MATPCRKCGATKTEMVEHGFAYKLAKTFGYRLRKCSRCHRMRLLERHESTDSPPPGFSVGQSGEGIVAAIPERKRTKRREPGTCPRCGGNDYQRSHRRWWERLLGRPPMARCRSCRHRFPFPRAVTATSD